MIFGGTVSRKRFETAREIAEAVSSMDAQQRISSLTTYIRSPHAYIRLSHIKNMDQFCKAFIELKIDDAMKWKSINCYYNFSKYLEELTSLLENTVDAIKEWCAKGSMDFSRLNL